MDIPKNLYRPSDPASASAAGRPDSAEEFARRTALFKTGALQKAILTSANYSIIATDEKGIIQLFNVGAERLLGYTQGHRGPPPQVAINSTAPKRLPRLVHMGMSTR